MTRNLVYQDCVYSASVKMKSRQYLNSAHYMVFGTKKRVSALVKGQKYYVRVDAFNEFGITEGRTVPLDA